MCACAREKHEREHMIARTRTIVRAYNELIFFLITIIMIFDKKFYSIHIFFISICYIYLDHVIK